MEGAYPTDVLSVLTRFRNEGKLNQQSYADTAEPISKQQIRPSGGILSNGRGPMDEIESAMPEPHPLDFDWRFAVRSLPVFDRLLAELDASTIGILGAPTLYLHMLKSRAIVHLYDKNAQLVDKFIEGGFSTVTHCDLFEDQLATEAYDAVVADPPWYLDHYFAFIDGARQLLKPEGHLLLSMLPRLTRPSAANDRKAIVDYAFGRGFDLWQVLPAALSYESPPFELAALKAEGIELSRWRSGDLFAFVLTTRDTIPMARQDSPAVDRWESFEIGKTVVRVKVRSADNEEFHFEPVSPSGDLHLHSVSRRSPVRPSIDVWSSRNFAMKVSRPDCVSDLLRQTAGGLRYKDALCKVAAEKKLSSAGEQALGKIVALLLNDAGIDGDV
jgi:hypothetical protein